jgi:hypothetical protein
MAKEARLNIGGMVALVRRALGRVVIRTVWLGLTLLVFIIGLASFKLAVGSPRPMALTQASAVVAERDLPEIDSGPEALTKGDRLPVGYISSAEPPATELKVPPEPTSAAPKIAIRHWHDPSTSKAGQAGTKKSKSKAPKRHARVIERKTSAPEACNPLRRIFEPATACKN